MSSIHPSLVYHSSDPPLFPTDLPVSLLAVRFPTPVRLSSIVITPEGVDSPSGPGVTWPAQWQATVLVNVSGSNPVNAMVQTQLDVDSAEHALEYPIDMPEGTTTRLVLFLAPVESLTISLYGWTGAERIAERAMDVGKEVREDLGWVSGWAGGVEGLMSLLDGRSGEEIRGKALDCLEILVARDRQAVVATLATHSGAVESLLSLRDLPPNLCQLVEDPGFALHPDIRRRLPPVHPLYPLSTEELQERRKEAWKHLYLGRSALSILAEKRASDLLEIAAGEDRTNFSRLLEQARGYARSAEPEDIRCLELALDVLAPPADNDFMLAKLSTALPHLYVVSRSRGSDRSLALPASHARTVIIALLKTSTEVIDGQPSFKHARALAEPYFPYLAETDPLLLSFTGPSPPPILQELDQSTTPSRQVSRLASAIADPTKPTSLIHQVTPSSLISLLAPQYHARLSRAPLPPLGISSGASLVPGEQASAWAGKVYSSHEFRTREGSALVLPGKVSRPASRHVDDYAG